MMMTYNGPVWDDDDDDGILTVGDEILSFSFLDDDDDDVMRHQKKWQRHDNLAVTINDAAPCTSPNSGNPRETRVNI